MRCSHGRLPLFPPFAALTASRHVSTYALDIITFTAEARWDRRLKHLSFTLVARWNKFASLKTYTCGFLFVSDLYVHFLHPKEFSWLKELAMSHARI